jgi:hypothetical protein
MPAKPLSELTLYVGLGVLAAAAIGVGYFLFAGTSAVVTTSFSGPAPGGASIPARSTRTPKTTPPPLVSTPLAPAEVAAASPERSVTTPLVDPAQALAEAVQETDPELRRKRILAILRAWAAVEPDAAALAALEWPAENRMEPIAAVLAGVATQNPDDALRLGTFFCREDPAWAPEHGRALIAELSQAGQFSAAVGFALAGGASVDGEERNKWLTTAFAGWAQREPQLAALAATSDLPESGMQQEALISVVSRWRQLNPDGPEKFLQQLPPGPERTALATALAATTRR